MDKKIDLTPDMHIPSHWKLKFDGKTGEHPGNYPIVDMGTNTGPQLIVFSIPPGAAEKFSTTDPIWIKQGQKPTGSGIASQFVDAHVFDGGKTLVVVDKNTVAGQFHYRLNIGAPAGKLDPIIENGGGTVPPVGIDYFSLGIALLAGFVVAFVVQRLFFKR